MKNRSVLDRNLPHDSALKAAGREMNVVGTAEEPKGKSRGRSATAFWSRPSTEAAMRILDIAASCMWHRLLNCDGSPTIEWLADRDERKIRLIEVIPTAEESKTDKTAGVKRRGPQWEFFSGTDEEWDLARERDAKAAAELYNARDKPGEKDALKRRRETPKTMPTTFTSNRSATTAVLCPARVAELIVNQVLGELDAHAFHQSLIMHAFPRFGPYARTDAQRSFRTFRPTYGSAALLKDNPHLRHAGTLHLFKRGFGGRHLEKIIDEALEEMIRIVVTAIASCWANTRDMQDLAAMLELVQPGTRTPGEVLRSAADTRKDLPQKWPPGLRAEQLVGSVVRVEPLVAGMAEMLATVTTEIDGGLLLEFGVKWGMVVEVGWITENCSAWAEPEEEAS